MIGEAGAPWQACGALDRLAFGPVPPTLCRLDLRETREILSYVVTVIGLPRAIAVFVYEQRRERQNEEEDIFQRLSDEYPEFLQLVLDNAYLHLLLRDGVRHAEFRDALPQLLEGEDPEFTA